MDIGAREADLNTIPGLDRQQTAILIPELRIPISHLPGVG
jgi:hypothetical protein